jgi:L-iditol 2-dehydrogenase
LDVRGCWGSDFSHFYRGVEIVSDERRAQPWCEMSLAKFGLRDANEALAKVASGEVLKALVDPRI